MQAQELPAAQLLQREQQAGSETEHTALTTAREPGGVHAGVPQAKATGAGGERVNPGDVILTSVAEYASNYLAYLRAADRAQTGVEVAER